MTGVHPVLDQTRKLLAAELAGRTAAQVAHHPGNDTARWNAQQVIEHLATTWRLTTQGLEDRLQKGRPLQARPTQRQRLGQLLVCNLGYFPKGREAPVTTLPPAEPHSMMDGDAVVAHIHSTLTVMDNALSRMEPGTGSGVVLTHPVLGPLTVTQWRRFHRAHARHHAKQIRTAVSGS